MMGNTSLVSPGTTRNSSRSFTEQASGPRFYRMDQLLNLIPLSKATVWRKVKDGSFPRPVKLSVRITAWRADEIAAWLNQRLEA